MNHRHLIIFDGVCNLCNGLVDFIIRKDTKKKFRFATLQSSFAKKLLSENEIINDKLNTVYYWRNNELLKKSSAILFIGKDLGGVYKILIVFIILPKPIRDFFYALVARSRTKVFGKRTTCRLPAKEEQDRFINEE